MSGGTRLTSLTLTALLVSCGHSVANSGGMCALNSDCAPPLVCAAGLCRDQCRVDRDCGGGATCVLYGDTGVCVPPAMPVPCAYTSQCGDGQVCLSGTCRAQCVTDVDCAAGHCVMGSCDAPTTTTTADGGVDASASPDATPGCTLCGARCVDLMTDREHCGRCDDACAPGAACAAGACTMVTCPPSGPCNQTCAGAQFLTIRPGVRTSVTFDPSGYATEDYGCDPSQPTGYYRFHLDERSLVSFQTICNECDIGLVDVGCDASQPPRCSAGCGGNSDSLTEVLDAGDVVFELNQPLTSGPLLVDIYVLPIPASIPLDQIPAAAGFDVSGPLGGGGLDACGATGPAHVWWLSGCALGVPTLQVSTCGSTADINLTIVDAVGGASPACGSTDTTCAIGETASIGLGAGVVALIVASARTPGATGTARIAGSLH